MNNSFFMGDVGAVIRAAVGVNESVLAAPVTEDADKDPELFLMRSAPGSSGLGVTTREARPTFPVGAETH